MPRIPRISRRPPASAYEPEPTTEFAPVPAAAADPPTEVTAPAAGAPPAGPGPPPAVTAEIPAAGAQGAPPEAATVADVAPPPEPQPSFLDRGRMRRRLRYLRRARELALRDLGGLVFDLRRFGRTREDLVAAKLERLSAIQGELGALEAALDDRQEVVVLREPGLAACPRCGALHGSDANYCSACALPVHPGAGRPVGSASSGAGETSPV